MTAVILVADGARPDTLAAAMDAGDLPALAALRRDGAAHTITTVFPSVTGPAYVPFVMGLHPGAAGVPGTRWWDRQASRAYAHGSARSYVGFEALRQDGDLAAAHATLFELAERPLAALTPIGRGLGEGDRIGAELAMWPRMLWTHFRGGTDSWLRLESALADRFATRIATGAHDVAVFAHPGIDKCSHADGHDAPSVRAAMRNVDAMVARLRDDAARRGRPLELIVVSDHGHATVHSHLDLAGLVRSLGIGTLAHPWSFLGGDEAAVMVSGNAMAHVYLELARRDRPWWPALTARWRPLVEALLAHEAIDQLLLPHGPDACEVRTARRGRAMLRRLPGDRVRYEPIDGDPLELAHALDASGSLGGAAGLDSADAWDVTRATTYPDSLVQILALAGAPRSGEVLVTAAPGWDLRARWEPIPHRSTHGALHRDQMLVPLLTSFALDTAPRRTTEVFGLVRGRPRQRIASATRA